MFERVELTWAHCWFCRKYGQVAGLKVTLGSYKECVDACEKCLRTTGKVAYLLALLRKAKAPPPKKARKGSQSSGTAPPRPPKAEAVSSLVPEDDLIS